jgi:Fic family protein
MRTFDYSILDQMPIPSEIVKYLTQIHEFKGKQNLYHQQQPEMLEALVQVAKIQSIGASNRIEGIRTSEKRLMELAQQRVTPKNGDEEEISGYRLVLEMIHDSHDAIPLSSNVILQLHRDLYRFSSSSFGGHYKNADNVIEEIDEFGQRSIRFKPLPAFETPTAMQELCQTYLSTVLRKQTDLLILIPMFSLHPSF